jgi:hypothetical protein
MTAIFEFNALMAAPQPAGGAVQSERGKHWKFSSAFVWLEPKIFLVRPCANPVIPSNPSQVDPNSPARFRSVSTVTAQAAKGAKL